MPIYTYKCEECKHEFDIRQSYKDKPVTECPKCQAEARRVFCPVPIVFKGPGFYTTDSRAGAAGAASAGDK
ncbi:MAG: zinc ribbon domain-containing protein [Dehalococcoidia bacterium]|nr:zinc ribbon domain-containing protein [Dehalococcoidia bacterium]